MYLQLLKLSKQVRMLESQQALSATRRLVLQAIVDNGPMTVKALADKQKVALPTMSKLIDELQKLSLVLRAHAKGDARQRLIIITQKGQAALNEATSSQQQLWQSINQQIPAEMQPAVSQSLNLLTQSLEQLIINNE